MMEPMACTWHYTTSVFKLLNGLLNSLGLKSRLELVILMHCVLSHPLDAMLIHTSFIPFIELKHTSNKCEISVKISFMTSSYKAMYVWICALSVLFLMATLEGLPHFRGPINNSFNLSIGNS